MAHAQPDRPLMVVAGDFVYVAGFECVDFDFSLISRFTICGLFEVNISLEFSINIDLLMKPTVVVSHG